MRPHAHVNTRPAGPEADAPRRRRGEVPPTISARHHLLSDSWTADVDALEVAMIRFGTEGNLTNSCDIACFEIAGDAGHLHVNVTHRYATEAVKGWAGPGRMPDGFVHNRQFSNDSRRAMIRDVTDMVFAARL